ncbi:MAG: phage tail protein [Bacteroidetes bacterium]|jgi:phage baseplate assembly protein W|nr:phage tail protein [Bacteroidota bacterium]
MADSILGRGIAFPPRIGADGRLAWSEGAQNVRESIRVILLTDLRERLMRPTFGGGLQALLFEPNTLATRRMLEERTRRALERWEPRIRLDRITAEPDPDDPSAAIVEIVYRIVATGARERTSLSVQLDAG